MERREGSLLMRVRMGECMWCSCACMYMAVTWCALTRMLASIISCMGHPQVGWVSTLVPLPQQLFAHVYIWTCTVQAAPSVAESVCRR